VNGAPVTTWYAPSAQTEGWLLASEEPAARWVALTQLQGRTEDDPAVGAARTGMLADPATLALVERLPDWLRGDAFSGHEGPSFAPNLLNLLADMGVRAGDFDAIERVLDQMLAHQDASGRFESYGALRRGDPPVWGSLLCDTHAVTEVLVRFGRQDDPRVRRGLERMALDLAPTVQGPAWPCLPHTKTGWRGPGRKQDFCPMVTLQALRTFARLPSAGPDGILDVARVTARSWRVRASEKPYMFGHGRQFKTVKWPVTWYGAYAVVDTLGRYPALWTGTGAQPEDRLAVTELTACLVAYNVDSDGRVTPRSTFRGFQAYSFGQKKQPSPLATALLAAVVLRVSDLAPDIAAVDVTSLGSSKGGRGTALPPDLPATRA
jgi:hypothetical protein